MIYLITKISLLLIFALFIGVWAGWQIHGFEFKHKLSNLQNEWAGRFRSADRERDIAIKKSTTLDLKSKQLKQQLEVTGRLIKRFEASQAEAQSTIEGDLSVIEQLSKTVDQLKADLNERDIKLKKFSTLLKTLQKLEREQKQKIRSGSGTIERLMLQAQEKSAQINELNTDLKKLESTQHSAQEASSGIKEQYFDLQAKLKDRESKLDLIKSELESQKKTANTLEKELHIIQSHVTTAPANDVSINLELSSEPVWILKEASDNPDDLQQIRGIGPVMQRLLNEIGIYHFNQLARMTESDCLWVADRIRTFPKRIKRDRWQQQAVELDLDRMERGEFTLAPKKVVLETNGEEE